MENKMFEAIIAEAKRLGVFKANVIEAKKIEPLMAELKNYEYALVYQTVSELEDNYDFEGMIEAKKKTYPIAQALRHVFSEMGLNKVLHLGAGGCGVCGACAKQTGEPCRFPALALPSLEAYGINESQLAKAADMKYINGQDTVTTYFGAVLFLLTESNDE
jgi:predicted metal-binding protein